MAINDSKDFKLQEQVYAVTSTALAKMPDSERMLFDVRMKLCRAYINRNAYDEASEVLNGLHKSCQTHDGQDDKKTKGSELLEIYSLQLMISAAQGDNVRLKELFEKTKDLTAAVKDPRSQSIIRECWGMMFGDEGQWQRAKAEFFSAFVSYDEIGNAVKAKQCLKYVVVSNMLSGSDANPFDDRAAKVYENDKEIALIGQLRNSFEKCDVNAFNRSLDEINRAKDHFIQKHLESMVNDFQARSIISMIKSYRRIRITHLAEQLRVDPGRVEEILIHLILDGAVLGKIDQVKGMLDLTQRTGGGAKKYGALDIWAGTLQTLANNLPQPASQM
jgi:COP9 signalosome complex subunit 2